MTVPFVQPVPSVHQTQPFGPRLKVYLLDPEGTLQVPSRKLKPPTKTQMTGF